MTDPKPSPAWQGLRPTGKTRRVLVTGSRAWVGYADIWLALRSQISEGEEITVVHGGCPTGADRIASIWTRLANLAEEKHPADWKTHGKAAGPIRNQLMVDLGADICLAFPLRSSRGTFDCIRRAEKAGIPVINYGAAK